IKSSDRFGNFSYSDYDKLTIDYTVGKSVCVEPAGNSYFTDRTPIFRWAKVADADSYMLQLSAVPNFSYAIFSQYFYDTVYTLSTQLSDSIYYWRIISVDTAGNINYSDSSKFTVDNIAPVLLVSTDSNIIQSGQNYSGYIEEKNIDTGFIFINSDTFYLSFFQITDTIVMFNVNISVNPGINYVRLSVTDKVGLTDTSQYIIYLASNLVSYSQDTVYSISDTGSLIIQFNDGILSPSFGVSISNPSLNNFDTIYVGMNFKNTVVMPVRMMISSLADSNLIYDTINAVRASETKNSVIEIVLYDNNYSRIEENEDIFDTAYIEFEIDKNKINNLGTKSFGIFTVAPINNRWYEINNENMPGGKVISGNYIYTDTSVAAYIKHFSIYSVINASLISADNIGDNIVIYPNPYTPNKQGSGSISASAAGGIHFGLDNNSDGTIDNGLPLNTEIVIYTLLGEKVSSGTVLSNGITIWDAKDKNGTSCASGLYLAVIKHNGKTIVKKIAVVR
ncbi:T9SS type A sorting domain-containing protein, partial [Candidatus Dependentiae bacterium]|nr:T9SS type A sorting domain-containing protein [Candidatus Dependentiae bacterium]